MKAITGGGGKDDTCDHAACMSRSWKVEVCQKKKTLLVEEMINQQIAARSTPSTKQNKPVFVSSVPTRPLALGRQTITATESETTATAKHAILQRVFSGKKKRQTRPTRRLIARTCKVFRFARKLSSAPARPRKQTESPPKGWVGVRVRVRLRVRVGSGVGLVWAA